MALLDVAQLRSLRNSVIGSRTKKSELVSQGKIPSFVALLDDPESGHELQSLAATIIGSLAHGAPAPTLLSMCRAHTTEALLASLRRLSTSFTADPYDTANLKLVESLLRALRSLLMALADEISPGTKWERGLGLSSRLDVAATSHLKGRALAGMGKSSREIVGWHIADAGFDTDGDTQMTSTSTSKGDGVLLVKADLPTTSPREELMLSARRSISFALSEENLPYWLGTLFISKIPLLKSVKSTTSSQLTSLANSRSSTRPTSPALPSFPTLSDLVTSRSSSRMSSSSQQRFSNSPGSSRPSTPIMSNQVRLLAITEMVLGILSSCFAISGQEETSPGLTLKKRRRIILDFVASDSPFWNPGPHEERGRKKESQTVGEPMQAFFVKRGKSTDVNEEENAQTDSDDTFISSSKGLLDVLLEATECGYAKTQEAALWALTDLSRENSDTSGRLFACLTPSGMIPTSMLLNLRMDSSAPIRLAAFCCLAHIIKVHPFTPKTNECVLSVLVELMDFSGDVQVAAIFALAKLLADDSDLQMLACDQYDCIDKLAKLLGKSKQITVKLGNETTIDDHSLRLREATLTALASLCFQSDEIRRKLVDHTTPTLLPSIVVSLSAPQLGIRIAACRLIRALSRSISILRTSLVDAGVAAKLLAILHNQEEDEQVKVEATASVCNLVLNFSPMKQILLEGGGIEKLVELARSSFGPSKLNALWALKNLLYASDAATKRLVMDCLKWDFIFEMAYKSREGEEELQEQALNIIQNLCSCQEGDIEVALHGFGGGPKLLDMVEEVIWEQKNDNVLEQAAFIIVNVATGSEEHRRLIINRPNLLDALAYFLNHPRPEVREAGIWAVTNLTQPFPRGTIVAIEAVNRLKKFHFDRRLKELIDDPERDVSDRAKGLLGRFVD
ncbi:hypothetical protein CBS101457_001720 [Exobasidium rhododendri]|nr:hypothetical protein CBS101457_001720 [Exobasidium rhododendri]